uniref:Uncharacterized protein n=1 Tax=Setaria italica TaxID=4555 RepID=K3ZPG4_SETIT
MYHQLSKAQFLIMAYSSFTLDLYAPFSSNFHTVLAYKCLKLKQSCCIQSVLAITLELEDFTVNITCTVPKSWCCLSVLDWIWAASHRGCEF